MEGVDGGWVQASYILSWMQLSLVKNEIIGRLLCHSTRFLSLVLKEEGDDRAYAKCGNASLLTELVRHDLLHHSAVLVKTEAEEAERDGFD